jgi:hypothetical protein
MSDEKPMGRPPDQRLACADVPLAFWPRLRCNPFRPILPHEVARRNGEKATSHLLAVLGGKGLR